MQMLYVEHDSTQEVVCRVQCTRRGYIQATAVIRLACTNLQTFMESKTESSKRHAQNTDINTNVKCFQNSHVTNATSVKRIMSNYKSHQIQNTTKPQKNAVNQWKAHQSWQYFIRDATCRKHKKAQEQKTSKWKRKQCRIKETQCKTKISNAKEARFWNARMQDFQIQDVGCAHNLHKMPQKQSKGEALQSTHEAYICKETK